MKLFTVLFALMSFSAFAANHGDHAVESDANLDAETREAVIKQKKAVDEEVESDEEKKEPALSY